MNIQHLVNQFMGMGTKIAALSSMYQVVNFAISVSKREELTYDEIKELMTHEGNKFSFKNSFL